MDYQRLPPSRARLGCSSLFALLVVASGCPQDPEPPGDDDPTTTSDSAEPTGDPSPDTDGPSVDPSSGGSGMSATETGIETETETEPTSTTDAVPAWSDVPCAEGVCVGSEVCVQPGTGCDYSPCRKGEEAEWVNHPPECQPFLDDCDPADPEACLAQEYCSLSEFASFQDGYLECAPTADDCYCF